MIPRGATTRVVLLLVLVTGQRLQAQMLPDGPVTFADGRVRVSGEVTATTSTVAGSDEGWFNYSSYRHNILRNLRVAVASEVRVSSHVALVGEVRSDHFEWPEAYAAFVRVRPWQRRAIDVHVGRVPPTFGAFARRPYNADNVVVGMPLAYQYLTTLRADVLPRHADDVAAARARGWNVRDPRGLEAEGPGLPLVNALQWDTGVQVRGQHGRLVWLTSVTTGTLSNPRVRDDNGRPQLAGRVTYAPVPAVTLGASVARGPYLSRRLDEVLRPLGTTAARADQRAAGADLEVSRGRWLLRAEAMRSTWDVPSGDAPRLPPSLGAWSILTEARVRLAPGVDVAGRVERLDFSDIVASAGPLSWDAPVERAEFALAWSPQRRLTLKAGWQINTREAGRIRSKHVGALQCIAWF